MQDNTSPCTPKKDFMRHIVNHVLSDIAGRLPITVFNELRSRLSRAEEKYKFSVFGGDPIRLKDYLESSDFEDLIIYAKSMEASQVIAMILKELIKAYREQCPIVSQIAEKVLMKVEKFEESEKAKITPEVVYRAMKMRGYKADIDTEQGIVTVSGPNFSLEVRIVNGSIKYIICREGKTTNINALISKIEKLREL